MKRALFMVWGFSSVFMDLSYARQGGAIPEKCKVVRCGIDIGSGTSKLVVATFDTCSKKIGEVLVELREKNDLLTPLKNGVLPETVLDNTFKILTTFSQEAAKRGAKMCHAVATEAFRLTQNTKNSKDLISKAAAIGVDIRVISREEEALLGYKAVLLNGNEWMKSFVVWDIGGGSQEFSVLTRDLGVGEENSLKVSDLLTFHSPLASHSFRDSVISQIKRNDPFVTHSPNPITKQDYDGSREIVRSNLSSFDFKEFKKNFEGKVIYGIGEVFNKSLEKILKNGVLTLDSLQYLCEERMNKTDEQLGEDYASTQASNVLLVEHMMNILGVKSIQVIPVHLGHGLLDNDDLVGGR